ncbi:hypothetical protein [Caldimonas brevitalea]|uniref:Uncharacterized protein n=1 Tax=Caldimonas brevitalea TaxID=413882 RepID=A0A0G3BHQ5_9BURK|nr:hypothetical protein [Caldimonas brevitalea]AKJ26886.1 hypothetical protein AAW51_0195 [Caldimonas brevitalea]
MSIKKQSLIGTTVALTLAAATGLASAQFATPTGPQGEALSSRGPGSNSGSVEPNSPLSRGTHAADGERTAPEASYSNVPSTSGSRLDAPAGSSGTMSSPSTPAAPQTSPMAPSGDATGSDQLNAPAGGAIQTAPGTTTAPR